jgi:heme a synthase
LSGMAGGVLYEHSHRLIGSVVGALTLTLAAVLWALDRRSWVRRLGVAALGAVIVQGILGGLRVVLVAEELAIVHGAFAQAFFALVAGLALVTSSAWNAPVEPNATQALRRVRRLALITTVGLYVQVMLGALVTHLGARVDAHLGLAGLISAAVILLGRRIPPGRAVWPELVFPMGMLRALWILQLVLGTGSYLAKFHPAIPMGPVLDLLFPLTHRLTGALMLVAGLVLTLRAYRRSGWPEAVPAPEGFSKRMAA